MHPILFKIGPMIIYSYGAMIAAAFLISIYFASRSIVGAGNNEKILDLGLVLLISGIIGARLLYVLVEAKYYKANPLEIIMIWKGGLIFYGGFIAAFVCCWIFLKKNKMPILRTCDHIIPYLALGQAIGRIGCFFNGCCFGKPTNLPWGMIFPVGSIAGDVYPGIHIHPTQLYSAYTNFLIFAILLLFRNWKKFDGQILYLYFILYSVSRFLIEFLRADNPQILLGLTISQVICVVLFLTGSVMYIRGFFAFIWRKG